MAARRPLFFNRTTGVVEELTTADTVDPAVIPAATSGMSIVETAVDTTNSTTTAVNVSGLGINVAANAIVQFRFSLVVDAAAATTGIQLALNGPASPVALTARIVVPTSTTTDQTLHVNAYETFIASLSSSGTVRGIAVIEGVLRNGTTAGVLIPRLKSEIGLSQVAVRIGSNASYH